MCRMFSFYATKAGEFYSLTDKTDEHSLVAAVFNLNDGVVSHFAQNLAKGEFIPPKDTKVWSDLSKWMLVVDEPETPGWFRPEKAREYMERLVRAMFITNERHWLVGGCWIFDGAKASAKGLLGGRIAGVINGANLGGANLYRANLDGANLDGANLGGANLGGANLDGARLDGANLVRANLHRANLGGANLDGANLGGARLPAGWAHTTNGSIKRQL